MKNCYKHHGREDLLYPFEDAQPRIPTPSSHTLTAQLVPQAMVQAINSDGMVSLIQVPSQQNRNEQMISIPVFYNILI